MFRLFLLFSFIGTRAAIEKTVCDCAAPLQVGILQFADSNCESEPKQKDIGEVDYEVYTEQRAALKFPAYICARWKLTKRVTMNLFGQVVVVPDKIALDTSAAACQIMQQSLKCDDESMTMKDNVWSYTQEPEEAGSWLRTVETKTINCALEQVTLYQEKDSDPIETPLGLVQPSAGTYSHNHMTIIWDAKYTTQVDHKARLLEGGTGQLIRMHRPSLNGTFRLKDDENQLDFHLINKPRCMTRSADCAKSNYTYDIIGETKLFVLIKKHKTQMPKENKKKTPLQKLAESEASNARAQLQYLQDVVLEHENDLATAIHNTQCDMRKLLHAQTVSTAQYNGWLAASQLKLPKCTKLAAAGQAVVAMRCTSRNVTFTTEITKCGPQPKFENWTINLDGWELVKFSPCYWTTGFVNFNDKPHAYRNNTWEPIAATIVVPQRDLADSFRYDDVKIFSYEHQTNPAYTELARGHMNIMADIAAAMNEHTSTNRSTGYASGQGSIVLTATEQIGITTFTSWFEKFKIAAFLILLIVVALLIARGCYAAGLCDVMWMCCCKKVSKPDTTRTARTTTRSNAIEMRQLRPLVNAAIRSQAV